MSTPAVYNFPDAYRNDGLQPANIILAYKSGVPVDMSTSSVVIQLKNSLGQIAWEFSSTSEDPDKTLLLLPEGTIQFPRVSSWTIPASKYFYDLQVISSDGYIRTFLTGTWVIKQDITT